LHLAAACDPVARAAQTQVVNPRKQVTNPAQLLEILKIGHETSMRGQGISLREALAHTNYGDLRSNFGPRELRPLINADPSLVEQWIAYSEDKRTSGGWYLTEEGEIGQVGKPESRMRFDSIEEAVAEYVVLELDFWAALDKVG
jgi:hypothetical protein